MKPATWLFVLVGVTGGCASTPSGPPREYYFATTGDDGIGDGSVARPYRTLTRASALKFNPGDRVLFEGGAVFRGTLSLDEHDAGTPQQPVTIGSFGRGRATIDAGEGTGVSVRDAGGVAVENLVVVGDGPDRNLGSGVHFGNDRGRRLRFVHVTNVEAHGFGREGIHLDAAGAAGFEDVRVERCLAYDNALCGIYVSGVADRGYPHANVAVVDCVARDNPGDADARDENRTGSGIFLSGVDGAVVDRCAASGNGARCRADRGGPMGIWAAESNRVTIQSCRSTGNRTGGRHDGGGFALDGGVTNSVMQYNYSSDNDGSGFGLFQYAGARPWRDNVVRYNVSVGDGRRNGYAGLHAWSGGSVLRGGWAYHNTIVSGGRSRALWVQSETTDLHVANNILCAARGGLVVDVAPGQRGIELTGNCYWSGEGVAPGIVWEGRPFDDVAAWRAATGQERGGVLVVNPRFTVQGEGVQRVAPAPGSPLRDAAVNLPVDTGGRDFLGTPLPQGRAPDVGAFEIVGG